MAQVDVGGIVVRLIGDAKSLEAAMKSGSASIKGFQQGADRDMRSFERSQRHSTC